MGMTGLRRFTYPLILATLPLAGIALSAVSQADPGVCPLGMNWSVDLNECVYTPVAGPGPVGPGPVGPGPVGPGPVGPGPVGPGPVGPGPVGPGR